MIKIAYLLLCNAFSHTRKLFLDARAEISRSQLGREGEGKWSDINFQANNEKLVKSPQRDGYRHP